MLAWKITRGWSNVSSLSLLLLAVVWQSSSGDEWLQFRGPGARGVADSPGLPEEWNAKQNIAWTRDIEGRGWSSPIVTHDRIFLTTVTRDEGEPEKAQPGLYFGGNRPKPPDVTHEWQVVCLDLKTGEPLWRKTLHRGKPATGRHIKNSYASETPVSDGKRIYVLFGEIGLFCLDLDGTSLWSLPIQARETRFGWGTAASPVLHEDRVYVISDNEVESFLMAVDKMTGKQVWRVARDEKSNWSTPFIWENEIRTEIVTPGTGKVRSYDLTGKLLYEFSGCSSITIATPYAAHGLLYISSGYVNDQKRPLFALRPGASGDITLPDDQSSSPFVAWCQKQAAPYNPTTIVYNDLLYVLHDRGIVAAFDARTGKPIVERMRIPEGQSFTASPWAANGRIYFLNEFGTTFVYEVGRDLRLLRTNVLPDEELYMATPVIVGKRLLIRSSKRLYCIAADTK